MLRAATGNDLPAIRQILRSSNDAPYDAAAVAEEKCFGRGIDGEPQTFLSDVAVATICGRYLRLLCVARDARRLGVGSAIVRELKPEIIGAEPGNYLIPGVMPEHGGFFERLGYRAKSETWNLHAPLSGGQAPSPVLVPPARTGEAPVLHDFIREHFGPTWAFEASRAAASFYIENTGFAVIEANNRGHGTFGPTGVVPSMRGRGFGRELLVAALAELSRMGYRRAIIPWTDSIEFYRRSCGAEPAHRFVTYTSRP